MADAKTKQKIQLFDGTNERGVALAYPIYTAISDGTEVANVNASNQLEVEIKNASVTIDDGGSSITVDGTVAATQSGVWNIGTVTTLTGITNDVNIADGGNSITVDAIDLDIRDLAHATDSVSIGDGTETLNITAAGEAEVDIAAQSLTALKISKDANANSAVNPIFVSFTEAVGAGEIHDYDTATVTKDLTDNHDYTVTATKTLLLSRVIGASSGAGKYEVQVGPVASLAAVGVKFGSPSNPNVEFVFDPPIEIPDTGTGTVRVIRRNDDNQDLDMYSTIIGKEV